MLIGKGMIAKSFSKYEDNNDVIIFASGVSNSKETRKAEFDREESLLKIFIDTNKKFVYFSTCSIYDEQLSDSKYISHKLNIENIIKENFKNYLIFRLPNVVGKSINPNTFFNFFKSKISNNQELEIHKNATRYLIDSDDLGSWLPNLIDKTSNDTINICLNNKETVLNLVTIMEDVLNKKVSKKIIDQGCNYEINNLYFIDYMNKNYIIDENYNLNIIKKHLS